MGACLSCQRDRPPSCCICGDAASKTWLRMSTEERNEWEWEMETEQFHHYTCRLRQVSPEQQDLQHELNPELAAVKQARYPKTSVEPRLHRISQGLPWDHRSPSFDIGPFELAADVVQQQMLARRMESQPQHQEPRIEQLSATVPSSEGRITQSTGNGSHRTVRGTGKSSNLADSQSVVVALSSPGSGNGSSSSLSQSVSSISSDDANSSSESIEQHNRLVSRHGVLPPPITA